MTILTLTDTAAASPTLITWIEGIAMAFPGGGGAGGAEPNGRINILVNPGTVQERRTVLDFATNAPIGLAEHNACLFVAWQSPDDVRRINLTYSLGGLFKPGEAEQNLTTFDETAASGVSIISYLDRLLLAWCGGPGLGGGEDNNRVNLAWSDTGFDWAGGVKLTWRPENKITRPNRSAFRPALASWPTREKDYYQPGKKLGVFWVDQDKSGLLSVAQALDDDFASLQPYDAQQVARVVRAEGAPPADLVRDPAPILLDAGVSAATTEDGLCLTSINRINTYDEDGNITSWVNGLAIMSGTTGSATDKFDVVPAMYHLNTSTQTSDFAPGVAMSANIHGPNETVVAWVGTDAHRTLNTAHPSDL